MDFREGRKIGERIEEEYEPLRFGNGYDHNWVLKNKGNFEKVAELMAEESGIVMELTRIVRECRFIRRTL